MRILRSTSTPANTKPKKCISTGSVPVYIFFRIQRYDGDEMASVCQNAILQYQVASCWYNLVHVLETSTRVLQYDVFGTLYY